MDLKTLKGIAEKFRPIADDLNAVRDLANQLDEYDEPEVDELCIRLHDARDGDMVRRIIDEVRGRTE